MQFFFSLLLCAHSYFDILLARNRGDGNMNQSAVHTKRHQSRIITINVIAYRVAADAAAAAAIAAVVRCVANHTQRALTLALSHCDSRIRRTKPKRKTTARRRRQHRWRRIEWSARANIFLSFSAIEPTCIGLNCICLCLWGWEVWALKKYMLSFSKHAKHTIFPIRACTVQLVLNSRRNRNTIFVFLCRSDIFSFRSVWILLRSLSHMSSIAKRK